MLIPLVDVGANYVCETGVYIPGRCRICDLILNAFYAVFLETIFIRRR